MRGKDDGRSGRCPETIEAGMAGNPQAVKPASFVNGFVCEVGQYRWIVNMMH